ncbi:MAG TPA: hypothetical protein VGB85_12710 [Nannocystis sp.]
MLYALAPLLLSAGLVAPSPDPPLLPASATSTHAVASPASSTPDAVRTATTPAEESARSATARAHYAARRYREAALVYERLWHDTQAPKYRFNAGMARAAAEHDAAAIVHWQAYLTLAPTIAAGERSMLEAEIAAAKRRTTPVQLRVQGPLAPATLTLRVPDGAPQGPRDPIALVPAATIDLSLEPGTWIATLTRPGRPEATASFEVTAGAEPTITLGADAPAPTPAPTPEVIPPPPAPATLTLDLGPRRALARGITVTPIGPAPADARTLHTTSATWTLPAGAWTLRATAPDHRPTTTTITLGPADARRLALHLPRDRPANTRLGLGLGLGGAGLVLLTTGTVLTARTSGALTCFDRESCTAAADRVLDRSIGASLMGAGLGVAAPALTAGLGRRASTDRALMIEAGLGAVILAGGVGWYFSEVTRTTALDHMPRQHAAAALRGLGGGMLGAAVVGLIVRRLTRSRPSTVSLAPSFSRHTRGLALQAHF